MKGKLFGIMMYLVKCWNTMVKDIVLDTHVLVDFLEQFYSNNIVGNGLFVEKGFLNKKIVQKINTILTLYRNEELFANGLVVTSIFSFIEIARKFTIVSEGKFNIYQFRAFLENRPEWVEIAPLNNEMFLRFFDVPNSVIIKDEVLPIEWPDAVHCVTYLMRDSAFIATHDSRIKAINSYEVL
jgi:hypothetical protein